MRNTASPFRYFVRLEAINTFTRKLDSFTEVIASKACPCEINVLELWAASEKNMDKALQRVPLTYKDYRVTAFNCLNPCNHNHTT